MNADTVVQTIQSVIAPTGVHPSYAIEYKYLRLKTRS